jgi:uncharacterized repeat protein (TIGR03803 family)
MTKMLKMLSIITVLAAVLGATFAHNRAVANGFPIGVSSRSTESVLYSFQGGADGAYPESDLIGDSNGALYGTTYGGFDDPGTVFKLSPSNNGYVESVLYRFQGKPDAAAPRAGLLADGAGDLYGTTEAGGTSNNGAVYKLTPKGDGYTESVVYSFQYTPDGSLPRSSLIADSAGALYGTTAGGGSFGEGSVFKLTPKSNGYSESILYSFQSGLDGRLPWAGLLADANGNLYGTTHDGGGPRFDGVVFELTPSNGGYTESILHRFRGLDDGRNPQATLIADRNGVMYGTTLGSASANCLHCGTVFRLKPNGAEFEYRVVFRFPGPTNGFYPHEIVGDGTGALYGTTEFGGSGGLGTVFKLTPQGNGYSMKILHNFRLRTDGAYSEAGLIRDNTGALYGTTYEGGSRNSLGFGTVFKVVP